MAVTYWQGGKRITKIWKEEEKEIYENVNIPDICHYFTQPQFEAKKFYIEGVLVRDKTVREILQCLKRIFFAFQLQNFTPG